jgi:hypothetical protein
MFDSNHVQNDFIYQTGGSTSDAAKKIGHRHLPHAFHLLHMSGPHPGLIPSPAFLPNHT